MITLTRSASIAPGKAREAIAYAKQIAQYLREEHGTTAEILMPVGGNPYRIAWQIRLAGLAEVDGLSAKLNADNEYLEMIAKNSAWVSPGSVHDDMWRTV
jgi:hypothetical protein